MSGVRGRTLLAVCAALLQIGVATSTCSSSKPDPAPRPVIQLWETSNRSSPSRN